MDMVVHHIAAKQNANAYDVARKELFRDYELMDQTQSYHLH